MPGQHAVSVPHAFSLLLQGVRVAGDLDAEVGLDEGGLEAGAVREGHGAPGHEALLQCRLLGESFTLLLGLALALGMAMYGREEEADGLVTTLLHDDDPILRYGAMHTIAFAYACSGDRKSVV